MKSSVANLIHLNLKLALMVGIMATLTIGKEVRASSLVKIDDAFWGLNSIVYDTVTELDWLPPIQTVNQSYNTVASHLGSGGYNNFHYASLANINSLLADADLSDSSDYNWRFRATSFVNLFRPTYSGCVIIYCYIGVSGMFEDLGTSPQYLNVQGPSDGDLFAGISMGTLSDNDWTSPNTGSWLVRPHGAVAPIPAPATLLLFGSGLTALAGTRLKRKKQ